MRPPLRTARGVIPGLVAFAFASQAGQQTAGQPIATVLMPVLATQPVAHDADDPAIWIHPSDPTKSLIFGTDKENKEGGIFVFNLDGKIVASFTGVDYPNNVDVIGPVTLGGKQMDIAVATERESNRLRILSIDRSTGAVKDVSGKTDVFTKDAEKNLRRPMGVALEKTPDGKVYAWLSRKEAPRTGPLGRFQLVVNGDKVDVGEYTTHGTFSGEGEIEAMLRVPDGRVFYCDEGFAIRMFDLKSGKTADFGKDVFTGDREGMAFVEANGRKLLLCSDQVDGGSEIEVFDITDQPKHVTTIKTNADSTDGIEATTRPLGARFPSGVLVMMNSKDRNFLIYDLREVLTRLPK